MLNALGNPLERLSETIDFEMFRETLEVGLYRERLTNAGAKPYDYVLMFKILVLQRMYNLSDEQTEYQIVDRTSFRNFLGLASGDRVPDGRKRRAEVLRHGMFSRVIGLARNAARNTLTNLVYNVCRYEQIVRLGMN